MLGDSLQAFRAILSRLPAAGWGSAERWPPAGSSAAGQRGRGRLKVPALGHVARVAAAGLLLAAVCSAQSYVISTFAGTSFDGDGGPATSAQLSGPTNVGVDSMGNIYIADGHRIRKVDTSGTITTIAGDGTAGFSGDGGPATSAQLSGPSDVALDSAGNVYIADAGNRRVRKVDTSGTITTIAGDGTEGFSGDGGPATAAQLGGPTGVAVDNVGNVYIGVFLSHRIRKVDTSGTITTFAGNGTAGFSGDGGPATAAQLNVFGGGGVAVDSAGNVYIADDLNHRIRKVDTSGTISTFAGNGTAGFSGDGGPATAARLTLPTDVAVDNAGNVYIVDRGNFRVRKVDTLGTITTIAGDGTFGVFGGDGGPATSAQLFLPGGVAADNAGNVYIADTHNERIRKVDTSGTITTIAGDGDFGFTGDGGPATSAQVSPSDVALDSAGNVYIAGGGGRIRKVDTLGTITTIAGDGTFSTSDVALDNAGNVYIVAIDNLIRKVDTLGTISTFAGNGTAGFSGDGGPATAARLDFPSGIAVDTAGNVYIADRFNHRIRKVDTSGTITTIAGDGTFGFGGDGGPAFAAQLRSPQDVALDTAGNVYIADTLNHRIRKVDTSGTISTFAGNGTAGFSGDGGPATAAQLTDPTADVAADNAGNVYIADRSTHRIRKVDTSGTITTIAGDGNFGFTGDGGPATSAQLFAPGGVAADTVGNVYFADTRNRPRSLAYLHNERQPSTDRQRRPGPSGDGGPRRHGYGHARRLGFLRPRRRPAHFHLDQRLWRSDGRNADGDAGARCPHHHPDRR